MKPACAATHTLPRLTPHAARAALILIVACSPTTTRPPFTPLPEALKTVINARPPEVVRQAEALLKTDSVALQVVSTKDAWLVTRDFAGTYKIRLWADPDVPGKSRVSLEAVYRPFEDPSRPPRELERAAPPGSPGALAAEKLLDALKQKLGFTTY